MGRYSIDLFKGMYVEENHWEIVENFYRTRGRKNQKIIPVKDSNKYERPLFKSTKFYKLKDKKSGKLAFAKYIRDNEKEIREFKILQSVNHRHAINLIEVTDEFGLVFPFYNWPKITQIKFSKILNKNVFKKELTNFFAFSRRKIINIGNLKKAVDILLIDLVDFNVSNIIVNVIDNKVIDWKFLDFEDTHKFSKSRNTCNIRRILKMVR